MSEQLGESMIDLFEFYKDEKILITKIKEFLDQGADINARIAVRMSLDNKIISYGPILLTATKYNYINIVKFLLEYPKIDINMQGLDNNHSALMLAVTNQNIEAIKLFLRKAAKVNLVDGNNNNVLARASHCDVSVIKYLLNKAKKQLTQEEFICFINNKSISGRTPLSYIISRPIQFMEILLKSVADPNIVSEEIHRELYDCKSDIRNKKLDLLIKKISTTIDECKILPKVLTHLIGEYIMGGIMRGNE